MSAVDALTDKEAFLASLARCQATEGFLTNFYVEFMGSNPEIKDRFRFTKIEQQVRMLDESLRVTCDAITGGPEGLARLKELGKTHDKFHHNARPEWYANWINALVDSASHSDPEWSENLETVWRKMLSFITQRMSSMYEG